MIQVVQMPLRASILLAQYIHHTLDDSVYAPLVASTYTSVNTVTLALLHLLFGRQNIRLKLDASAYCLFGSRSYLPPKGRTLAHAQFKHWCRQFMGGSKFILYEVRFQLQYDLHFLSFIIRICEWGEKLFFFSKTKIFIRNFFLFHIIIFNYKKILLMFIWNTVNPRMIVEVCANQRIC